MGRAGKDRTKFQPSSSSQAFSQIQQTGFIGFSSGLVPGGAISELSGDLQLAFKKAGKKDSTTKIKAFTELQHLFTTPEVDQNIESCLELWSKVFKDLLVERERRARETGLRAHDVLMGVAGRRLAPYLKKICGPWLLFMHDSNRNVRSLSSQAFFRAIPENKHVATWIFCKNDLITFLSDRLDQSKVAICPPTIAKGTEASEIYEENMAECLLGLSFLLRTLPENELQSVMDRLKEIVLRPSFWKLSKIKSSLVLSAFLSFLGHALKVLPVLRENPERTFLLFSDVLKSQDRLTCQLVWRPLFYFAQDGESSWDALTAKDLHQFETNLFAFLRAGASGTGSVSYPELARLVPALPVSFTNIHKGDQSKFFELLLQALWSGSQTRNGAQRALLTCYIDVLLYVTSRNNLPGGSGSHEETAPKWLPLFSAPLQEVLMETQWDVESEEFGSLGAEFVRIFNEFPTEQHSALPFIFESYKNTILQSMVPLADAEPRQQLQVATKVAVLMGAFQSITHPTTSADAEKLRQQVFSLANENLELFPNLIIVGEMMRSQPLHTLLPTDMPSLNYFETKIAPATSSLLAALPPDSPGMRSLLNILAQLLKQLSSNDQRTHAHVWKTLLEFFQQQPSRGVLLTFLKQNVTIDGSPEAWRCAVLDEIALSVAQSAPMSASEQGVFFEFLTFILGGQTMTSEASLITKSARVSVFEALVKHCALYHQEKVEEGESIHLRLQHIMYCLKLISECLATNLVSGASEGAKLRLDALTVFFTLSIDIKYFWKGYEVDMETFRIISTHVGVEDFAGLSGDLSLSLELLEKSPVAQTARHGWNMNASSVLSDYGKERRMEFLESLVDCIHDEMKTVETTWFRPYLHTEQVKLLLTVVEHSSTQFILDSVIQTESIWRSMKKSAVASFKALVDFYKLPIAFYHFQDASTPLNQLSPEDEKKSITYVRFLSFLTCLMKELGVEEIVGKSDFRRMWVLHELYCGYTLCKDLLIPPLDHTNVVEEDWALGAETLVDFVNKDLLFFSQSITSPFIKSMLTATLTRAKASERQLVDVYAMGYILRRSLSGDHQRSAEFLQQFESSLSSELMPSDIEKKDVLYYQAVLPEIVGNLKANQLASYDLENLYQAHMEALMSQQVTELGVETLIHFLGVDGIVQDASRADVVASLIVFISEWGQQQIPVVQDRAIQVQLLRLLSCLFRHPLIKEQVQAQIELVSSFVWGCVSTLSLPTELNTVHSVLFHAFKLLNMIYRVPSAKEGSLPESLAELCQWQIRLLEEISSDKYSPSQGTLYQALSQSLLVLPPSISISEDAALKLKSVLAVPHADIQKAAFVLLQRYIGRLSPLALEENSAPQLADLLPAHLSEHLGTDVKDLARAISDEHDDVNYQYRSDLVKVVTFCWTWMLICEFYRKQKAATRRLLSGALRTEVPNLMGFLFQYFEQHSASAVPNQQLDVRGFDPLFAESFDQFLCDMYLTILRTFPSLVREWWCNDCNRALTNYVEQFTTKQMSPTVIAQEISIIQEFKHNFDDFEVKGNAQIKQVQAFYEEDEVQLGICLTIPDSYPLRDIVVTTEKKIGVTEAQWRQWLLSMHMLLHTQDASILDAVLLWKERMDKLFEGIECCLICYSVFQASNNALPKLACKTCKNKFHSACLYKWFNTSHKSNCPLCQTPWME